MKSPACRLFVITAAAAPVAVILRHGPSKWYHVTRWDMSRDVFEPGAWFRGRLYEDKCDVSPDGVLFLYAAFKRIKYQGKYVYSYSAVSRTPWLHALALWSHQSTYEGGGRFVDNRSLILRGFAPAHFTSPTSNLTIVRGRAGVRPTSDAVPDADWSGYDHRRRVIFAKGGKLFRIVRKTPKELVDFGSLAPDPQPPPAYAKRKL
jgi:hypothetical protein